MSSTEGDSTANDWRKGALDYKETPLNACSIETFCTDQDSVPLCLGCYQLNETTGRRVGRLDFYDVPIHDIYDIESFGARHITIFGDNESSPPPGVLDGKWSNHPKQCEEKGFQNYYATAHANGEIWVHEITKSNTFMDARIVGKSNSPSESEGLCLALAWESPLYSPKEKSTSDGGLDTRIISSYSDGYTAIHRVKQDANNKLILELEHHWESHNMFGCPAEVWCANFIDENTVVTGGDEGSWKIWDLRQDLNTPIFHGKRDFEAGVTVLAPHPRIPNLLAVGSYDETIAIYDLTKTVDNASPDRRPEQLYKSESLTGGIWRLKWHPFDSNKLLVAAMHGGCVVGKFEGLDSKGSDLTLKIQNDFKLHKSMAYGIDWLATSSGVEAAASCSFYDKAMYLWNTGGSYSK